MNKNNFRRVGLLLVVLMFGSCARGIVAPPGLNSKLLDIKVNDTGTATIITVKTNNLPQYAAFKTKSPPSISVDLASTDAANVSGSMSVENGFVKKIAVTQLGESTGYSSRITITLEKPLSYTTSADGNDIVITVSKTEEQPAAESSLQGMQITSTTPLQGGLELTPSAAPEALAPLGMEESPTTAPEQPMVSAAPEISPTSPTTTEQATSEENMQTNVINVTPPAPSPEAPSESNVPPPTVSAPPAVSAPAEKKHKAEKQIAMVVPAAPVTPALRKIKIIHGIIVTPVPLIFKSNEAVLSKDAEEGLKRVADYMNEHEHLKLIIQGYSDAYGPEAYNKELSYYRTLWVKMALERYGVSSGRLVIKPMGTTKKFGQTKTTEARNRRVVLSIAK